MRIAITLFLFVCLTISGQPKITLEDIWQKYAFYPKTAQGFNVLKNGTTYADLSPHEDNGDLNLVRFDLRTGKKLGVIVNASDLKFNGRQLDLSTYEFSPDEDKILVSDKLENIYRRSPAAFYHVHDIASKKTVQLNETEKQMFPKFSPD